MFSFSGFPFPRARSLRISWLAAFSARVARHPLGCQFNQVTSAVKRQDFCELKAFINALLQPQTEIASGMSWQGTRVSC